MTLDEIRKLCEAATPGPWEAKECSRYGCNALAIQLEPYSTPADARFIAAARTLLPALLEVVEAARHWITVAETEPTSTDEAHQWGNACMDAAKETKEALAALEET